MDPVDPAVSVHFRPEKNDGYAIIESVSAKSGKVLLNQMKILFPEGSVTAILGPSGSGKSTLLNTLTDSLSINSRGIATVHLPGTAAFVPQEDQLHGFFTCKSYMCHYARLSRLSSRISKEELKKRIDSTLASLGLTAQSDTIVGDLFLKGLSGGQKRRLSVALEALTDPNTLFLDEPTSGLDAESALQTMEYLSAYARAAPNRRVILTIHQPSSFIWELVDNVVLLSKGSLMYEGSRENIEAFFTANDSPTPSHWNPADWYVTMVNDEFRDHVKSVEDWAKAYALWYSKHALGGESSAAFHLSNSDRLKQQRSASLAKIGGMDVVHTSRSTTILAVGELTYRYFLNLWFNPGILGTRVAMYSMLALMVGALFWGLGDDFAYDSIMSRSAVLFYCVAFFIFMSVAVLPFTVIERGIVDKEVLNGYYHPVAYQLAQGIATVPGTGLLALLTSVIILTMLKLKEPYWYFLNMFLALFTAESLAQMVSHMVPHFVIGMALVAGMYGFFMLFMGFMLVPSAFPAWLGWTYYVGFHTYSWRTFMFNEFQGETFPGTPFETGEDVLIFFEIEDVNRAHDMIVLASYGIALQLLSCVVLHIRFSYFKGPIAPIPDHPTGHQKPDLTLEEVKEEAHVKEVKEEARG